MTLRVAAVQHDIVWEKPSENFRRLSPQIEHAVGGGARLVVLSEMFSTGFTMNSAECAESLEGPSYEFLVEHSTMHGIWISGSVPTRWDDQIAYNTLVLAGPDGNVLRYKKNSSVQLFKGTGKLRRWNRVPPDRNRRRANIVLRLL